MHTKAAPAIALLQGRRPLPSLRPTSSCTNSSTSIARAGCVFSELPRRAEYLALWEEYEAGTSFEARLVRQVDRLEMGLQATVHEHQGAGDGAGEPAN